MKTLPFYENLDTSFVNLSALLRCLRERQFAGQIIVELNGYKAEITLDAKQQRTTVREHDQIAGRIAEGDEALQRLLIRARASGGTISVYQFAEDSEIAAQKISVSEEQAIEKSSVEKEFLSFAPAVNGNSKKEKFPAKEKFSAVAQSNDFLNLVPKNDAPLPLEFTNRVEERARQTQISEQDWQTFLQFAGELFGAVDEILKSANLNFPAMLTNARLEISADYPFLNPHSGVFNYRNGTVEMSAQVSAKLFAASIGEVLRRVFERVGDNPHHSEIYRAATEKILTLIRRRQTLCDQFFITPQLEKILGVY
ncbi:MAG: hypothetical protein ACR2GD_03135 [Pyrinomonadaceae bacterium]